MSKFQTFRNTKLKLLSLWELLRQSIKVKDIGIYDAHMVACKDILVKVVNAVYRNCHHIVWAAAAILCLSQGELGAFVDASLKIFVECKSQGVKGSPN